MKEKKVNWNFLLLEHWVKSCRTLYFMQLEFGVGEEIGVGEREGCVEVKTAFALC